MTDQVTLLYEGHGRPLPRHRQAFRLKTYEGEFSLEEMHVRLFSRTMKVARLVDAQGADVLPPLYQADFLWMKKGIARVTGIEVDDLSQNRTLQTWNVRLVGYRAEAHIDPPTL